MPFAGHDIGIGQTVGAVEGELAAAAKTKRVRALGNLFQPGGHVELRVALVDARPYASDPQHDQHEDDQDDHHGCKGEQVRVVERQHDQADDGDHHDADAVDEQGCHRFLHRRNLEEPVDDVGGITAVESLHLGPREVVGKGIGRPHEETALEALRDEGLQCAEHGGNKEKCKHHERQHEHGPEQNAEGDRVDERLDRGRHDDGKEADAQGKRQERQEVGTLEPQQGGKPLPRPRAAVCCVAGGRVAHGRLMQGI